MSVENGAWWGMSMQDDDREDRGEFREVGTCGQIAAGLENYVKELNCVLNEASLKGWGVGRVRGVGLEEQFGVFAERSWGLGRDGLEAAPKAACCPGKGWVGGSCSHLVKK